MKWNGWANNDDLAMELTNNFNASPGGFLVDPNSSYGSFAVGIGSGASRNVSLFARPTAGLWHHYAFVLDTTAPAAEQVVPYVDGQPVSLHQGRERHRGTGRSPTPRSTSCRAAGSTLFGAGDLDEVAIYDRALSPTTIAEHFAGIVTNKRPPASLQAPATRQSRRNGELRRLRLQRPRRHHRQIRVGPRRQRQLRDRHRHDPDRQPHLRHRRARSRSACG